ncbi:hypothetical protein V7S43_008688 [Phytophthora oleae]|uniref:RxLR effector protein n=1 Tax=Phytophthora oleae TaxID=2107226 RepID=A0ABD3FHP3_9STRA
MLAAFVSVGGAAVEAGGGDSIVTGLGNDNGKEHDLAQLHEQQHSGGGGADVSTGGAHGRQQQAITSITIRYHYHQ